MNDTTFDTPTVRLNTGYRRGATAAALGVLLAVQIAHPLSVFAGGCGACDDDQDGLTNEQEQLIYGTNLAIADSDGDRFGDGEETLVYGTDPLSLQSEPLILTGGGPAPGDRDGDSIPDGDETGIYGTDPDAFDTDADGRSDWSEIFADGTNPLNWDTDGDGYGDFAEGVNGGSALDPAMYPAP